MEEIRFYDKVRVSDPFSYVSTINTIWYRNLKGEYHSEFHEFSYLPLASSYYGVSVDKKGN
jgi:hypothetical protein